MTTEFLRAGTMAWLRGFAHGSALVAVVASGNAWSAPACIAQSGPLSTPVVELYTSEGCNSCPPADRWLSELRSEPGVVALAFHVDYWDRLGWKDRFASPAHTQRQATQQGSNGARFSYTPQVVVDGIDRPQWFSASPASSNRERGAALVDIKLQSDDKLVTATVNARPGAPARLAAYWAVTESNHQTAVKAGENQGSTLAHDFVVRRYLPVAAWNSSHESSVNLRFEPAAPAAAAHPSFVNLVVIDAATRRPVQAARLGCL